LVGNSFGHRTIVPRDEFLDFLQRTPVFIEGLVAAVP
jgi:hypothetical protein